MDAWYRESRREGALAERSDSTRTWKNGIGKAREQHRADLRGLEPAHQLTLIP